jgi:tRNA uridine 5-carbamoylmethylation protein Kti12
MKTPKRILVTGHPASGKTTFVKAIKKKYKYPVLHLDNVLWKKLLVETYPLEERIQIIQKFLSDNKKWIIEGETRHLVEQVIGHADRVYYLKHKFFLRQIFYITKRSMASPEIGFGQTITLLKHVISKHFRNISRKEPRKIEVLLGKYNERVVTLSDWKEIDEALQVV